MGEKIYGKEDLGIRWATSPTNYDKPKTDIDCYWQLEESFQYGYKNWVLVERLPKEKYADWFEKESAEIKQKVLESEAQVFGNQIGAQMNGRLVKMCFICGALVADTLMHVRFHNSGIKNG